MTSATRNTFTPPIPESRRWVEGVAFPADRPLINLSQAAPADPPPAPLLNAMSDALTRDDTHLYGAVLGRDDLRAGLAKAWSGFYGADVSPDQTAITAGCNQAFAAVIAATCGSGDEVIIPTPWYFNHKMWLDMANVAAVPLATGADLLPDPAKARALITDKTRAIALVSPNNPCGVEYAPSLIREFFDLARENGIKLILDETYRDFHSVPGAPHELLEIPDWDDTLIQLYSFSKSFRLTGHRVGAFFGNADLMFEAEKFLDTVAICPTQLGQIAALFGLENLSDWLSEQRQEVLDRRAAVEEHFAPLASKGWHLRGVGAYFAYIEHDFAQSSDEIAQRLVHEASLLLLPASMFLPDNDPSAPRAFRMAYANIDRAGIAETARRLAALDWPLAGA